MAKTAGLTIGFKFRGIYFLHLDSGIIEDELPISKTARNFVI